MFRESIAVAVDILIITADTGVIKILLIRRKNNPYKGQWALPGGFVKQSEELLDAAARELNEETGVSGVKLEQLHAFGSPERDPRGRVVTVSYIASLPKESALEAATDASDADWFPIYDLPELAFDHDEIVRFGIAWLRSRLEHSILHKELLPEKFTINELQSVYEAILGAPINNDDFTKQILNSGKLVESKSSVKPKLYSFSNGSSLFEDKLN